MADDTLNHNQNRNEAEEEEEEDQLNDKIIAAGVGHTSDLIYDISCRVPVKSVGRFRCVSKDWKNLLSSPKFLKNQFLFNNHQTKIITLRHFDFATIDFRNDGNNEGHPVAIYEALTFRSGNHRYHIYGSCYGLVLLFDTDSRELSIVNPITHEVRELPSLPLYIGRCYSHRFEFGYCLKDDEFTVIFVYNGGRRFSPVYMLKKNLWKRVEDSPSVLYGWGTFLNGCIHWLGFRGLDHSDVIFSFDLASERFQEVEIPEGLKKGFRVCLLGGYLSLVPHTTSSTDIWVMKKYGLRDSWTKYVTYNLHNLPRADPLFFWNGDESIVAGNTERLDLISLKQKTSAVIPVIGERSPNFCRDRKWTFVDSLFSPNCSNAIEGPNQVQV